MPTFILKSLQTQEKFCYGITVVRGKSKVMDKKMKTQISNNGTRCLIKTYLIDLSNFHLILVLYFGENLILYRLLRCAMFRVKLDPEKFCRQFL